MFLFRPVVAGHWRQHELWDGTYTVDDLLDIHEAMDAHEENKIRAQRWAEKNAR